MAFYNYATCAKRNKKLMNPSIVGRLRDLLTDSFKASRHTHRHGANMHAAFLFHSKPAALSTLPLIPIPTEMTRPNY